MKKIIEWFSLIIIAYIASRFSIYALIGLSIVVLPLAYHLGRKEKRALLEISGDITKSSKEIELDAVTLRSTSAQLTESGNALSKISTVLEEESIDVSDRSKSISQKADQSLTNAKQTLNAVEIGVAKAQSLQISMEHSIKLVESLQNQSQDNEKNLVSIYQTHAKISDNTKLIHDLVLQTRILSFNASVEASRAGEAGKGFSVVANEVGQLAELSSQSAKAIEEIIRSSENQIRQFLDHASQMRKTSEEEVQKIRKEMADSLEEILKGMQSIQSEAERNFQSLQSVHKDIQSVDQSMQLFNSQVHELREISEKNTTSTTEMERCNSSLGKNSENFSRLMSRVLALATGRKIINISPKLAHEKLKKFQILDVRRPDEFHDELGHIVGAKLITLNDKFEAELNRLDKEQSFLFVCRSGGRSERAARAAQRMGFKKIVNMEGGMLAWKKEGLPVDKAG